MNEVNFQKEVDSLWLKIEAWLEHTFPQVDFETQAHDLCIIGPDGDILLTRQPQRQEVWVGALKGGYHFKSVKGEWETAKGENLFTVLAKMLTPSE